MGVDPPRLICLVGSTLVSAKIGKEPVPSLLGAVANLCPKNLQLSAWLYYFNLHTFYLLSLICHLFLSCLQQPYPAFLFYFPFFRNDFLKLSRYRHPLHTLDENNVSWDHTKWSLLEKKLMYIFFFCGI